MQNNLQVAGYGRNNEQQRRRIAHHRSSQLYLGARVGGEWQCVGVDVDVTVVLMQM